MSTIDRICHDTYISDKGYKKIYAMVAFSGEVEFSENDPNAKKLMDKKFTETNMNPNLKGRDMRKAFDSGDYQVMIVANKFQTGFDQPKLCAMYVDKKLGGVECVQTLSRLNRTYPGKAEKGTFILDFFNNPEDILESFQPYYQTAELADVSNPDLIFDLFDKLRASGIFLWQEVEQFCEAFLQKSKSNAAIANICKPAVERWKLRYKSTVSAYKQAKEMFERSKKTAEAVLIANTENSFKECKKEKDVLEIFKKDLVNYACTIRDKVRENKLVMTQLENNTPEQAMLGDFPKAVDDAVMDSNEAHRNQMMQLLSDPSKAADFAKVVFDLLRLSPS